MLFSEIIIPPLWPIRQAICTRLNANHIKTRYGNPWCKSSVMTVLRNYAYTGNHLLQTTFREDYLTKRTLINNGELPQYHAENTHEAIIPLETFNAVQAEIARRAAKHTHPGRPQKVYPFTELLGAGRKPLHFGECDLGSAQANGGWQGQPSV